MRLLAAVGKAARKAHGDAGRTRALVEVLLLHRQLGRAAVLAEQRPASLPADLRALPTVDQYDSLLGGNSS